MRLSAKRGDEAPWERLGGREEYELLCRGRVEHAVEVREPLVLVSQIQRSGGTLLSQLFDGHPECHAHPHELTIGFPKSQIWPQLDLSAQETWYEHLYEKYSQKHLRLGYQKPAERTPDPDPDIYPFAFLPSLQKRIFDACVAGRTIERRRDVLDCYFTSYFNAWLDDQSLYARPKKAITAFAPRLNMVRESVEGFFADYPDGTLISIVRDPRAWYASVRTQPPFSEGEDVLRRWCRSTESTLEARRSYGDRVLVLTYEELVLDTEATMRRVAERIGITMLPILLEPTFNGRPIRANSFAAVERYGILPERTKAYRDSLDPETIRWIETQAGELYLRAGELAMQDLRPSC
jgi:hypothetical protein